MCSFQRVLQTEPTEAWKVPAAAAGLAGHRAAYSSLLMSIWGLACVIRA